MTTASATAGAVSPALLSRQRIIAKPGFNRWLVPPAALCIHLCIGMAYGFSVFWKPLQSAVLGADGKAVPECSAGAVTFGEKSAGTLKALFATDCNWSQFDLGWMFTFFFLLLGISAAIWGGWLERAGPRKAGLVSALCWCGGLLIGALGVYIHQLWLMWLGAGVIGGIGLGLGYISPVSTLIKWFPDRRGMATGTLPQRVGRHRHHETASVHGGDYADRADEQMLQETFGGQLIGQSALAYLDIKKDVALAAKAAAVGAGFVGLISLFNIFGRIDRDRRRRPARRCLHVHRSLHGDRAHARLERLRPPFGLPAGRR